jgi:hypothetical protein
MLTEGERVQSVKSHQPAFLKLGWHMTFTQNVIQRVVTRGKIAATEKETKPLEVLRLFITPFYRRT